MGVIMSGTMTDQVESPTYHQHLIGPNDTTIGIAVKYEISISALTRVNDRTTIENLQFARKFLDKTHINIPRTAKSASKIECVDNAQIVLDVHVEGLMRDLGNRLFIQEMQALDLLEENGWELEWAVHSYTSDLRAARQATDKHPTFHAKLEMMNRILMLGPPDKSEWILNEDRESCISCSKEFTWSFRRHHCRCCGEVEARPNVAFIHTNV